MQDISVKRQLFFYLSILTGFFVLIEIGIFIIASDLYLADAKLVAHHLKIPLSVVPGIIYFFSAQLILHFAYLIMIWLISLSMGYVFQLTDSQIENIGIIFWLFGIILILLANQYFYPNSKFTLLTHVFAKFIFFKWIVYAFTLVALGIIMFAVYGFILMMSKALKIIFFLILIISFLLTIFYYRDDAKIKEIATIEKPNVIIIGIDAVRPDFLGFFGSSLKTPYLDDFLNHATVFSDALTPIARTYPAWVSIFTGEYPKKHGVRFDLSEVIDFDLKMTLPAILHQHGYESIYATDDVRFSNIDERLGFDQIVSPPMGFNDFLLGTFNDFPLSNLVINTELGRYLFPESYANRAAHITYEPSSFLNRLRSILKQQRTKPLFLAVHFCLPHYPYTWASYPNNRHYLKNYRAALKKVDQQIFHFLIQLKANQLLEHSIVVMMSDHGEAIELSGDRATDPDLFVPGHNPTMPHFYPSSVKTELVNQSAGHGTDVLGLTQYHSLLAFRFFGLSGQSEKTMSGVVSLLDIKPTILGKLGITTPQQSGKSLLDFLSGEKTVVSSHQDFFLESDFSPESVHTVHPETRRVLFEGINFYEINPVTTKITVKHPMGELIISSKQYADLYGSWILALYPQHKKNRMPILVNLETGLWTNDLKSSLARQAPINHMIHAMQSFYGDDVKHIANG